MQSPYMIGQARCILAGVRAQLALVTPDVAMTAYVIPQMIRTTEPQWALRALVWFDGHVQGLVILEGGGVSRLEVAVIASERFDARMKFHVFQKLRDLEVCVRT